MNGWAQGFRLPPGGGSLSVSRGNVPREVVVALEGLAVLVVAGLGLPGAKVAGEAAEDLARADDEDRDEPRDEEEDELAGSGRQAGAGSPGRTGPGAAAPAAAARPHRRPFPAPRYPVPPPR